MIKRFFLLFVVFFVSSASSVSSGQQRLALEPNDVKAYERLVRVTGHVYITNHPSLGRTPASNGNVITFRRARRSNYAVGVIPDSEGKYEVLLSPGRYKIIFPDFNENRDGFIDMLALGQPRYLNVVKQPLSGIVFNIELTLSQ